MDLITLILLALGLSADAFAVSLSDGICSKKVSIKNAFAVSITFGSFQAIMPMLGYILGHTFSDVVSRFHHPIALILLSGIGINMIYEVIKERRLPEKSCELGNDIFMLKNLALQGLATSIDALAAGVSFAAIKANIFSSCLMIGTITFICCMISVYIGKKFGNLLGNRARVVGGVMLILIGSKLFFD